MAYVSDVPSAGNECFLCAAATGAEESLVVDRGSLAFILMNRFPYTSGHLMAVPVRHAPDLLAMTRDEGSAIFIATQRAIRVLTDVMHPMASTSASTREARRARAPSTCISTSCPAGPGTRISCLCSATSRSCPRISRPPRPRCARPSRVSDRYSPWQMGSVIKKRRKKMRKHKHKKMLKKTRWARRG